MTIDSFVTFLDRVGWPGVFLLIVVYAINRAFHWFSQRFGPRIERAFDAHLELMQILKANLQVLMKDLEILMQDHKTIHKVLGNHELKLDQIHTIVNKIPRPPSDSVPVPRTNPMPRQ